MNRRTTKMTLAGGAAVFGCLVAGTAHGQAIPNCNDTTMFPNPIYLAGSSAFEPTAGVMAIKLGALTGADKTTIIYKATSSCDGPNAIRDNTTLTGSASIYTPNATDPTKYDKATCSLDAAPTKADVGISDVFFENCPGFVTFPATMTDVQGPVQAMIFIVPESNTTQTNLTAEEAQDIWGCGMSGAVEPFTSDMTDTQQRNANSGTQGVVAKAINVPVGAFKGKMNTAGGDLVTSLTTAPNPGAAIGFLAADSYDTKRTQLNALAFRAFGQTKAYYADSTADTFDKKNVRDGHYVVTGPEHFFATYDATTKMITNAKAAKFIGWVNGTITTTAFDYITIEAKAGVVPQCAMKVTRDQDGGFLKPYTPEKPCGCYFESIATKIATPPGCTACPNGDADCSGGKKCFNTFCE